MKETTSFFYSGPSPQEGALLRSAVQIRPPRQRDLPALEGPFFIAVSGSGPSPQEGALLRPAVQIRPPRQRDLPILEGPFLLRFRLRDRALKRVRCEGRRSKSARPDRRTFRSWRVLFLLGFGFGAEPSRGCFAKVGGPNPPARKSEPRLSFLPYPRFQGF
jgi:hypothetical protein